ncbi:MAG: ABC transporter permease [Planctomycetota bacterium]
MKHLEGPASAARSTARSPNARALGRLMGRRTTRLALLFLAGLVLISAAAPLLPLASPAETHPEWALAPPGAGEDGAPAALCGRDALGRDLLSRIVWGARISLLTAFAASFVSLAIGVTWGAMAAWVGGWVDELMMRIVDLLFSIPFIFLVIFLGTLARGWGFTGTAANLVVFLVTLGLAYWLTMARVVHGQVVVWRGRESVQAARALGARRGAILVRHLLPNLVPVVIVTLTLTIPRILLVEAFLSYLGLGVQAPHVSWGILARDAVEVLTPIATPWWLVLFPSLAIVTTLSVLQYLGDAVRDAWSPKESY